jgi:hypothetical protein
MDQQTEQHETTPTNSYCTYLDYTVTRLSCTPYEQKTIPGTGPTAVPPQAPQFYYVVPLMYNLGSTDAPVLSEFHFEACELETSFGIQGKPGPNGRLEYSLMVKFDLNNNDNVRFLECINDIHSGCGYILGKIKGGVKLFNFNPDMAEATGLKNPIYRPRDEMTGDIIQGRAPSMFLKLFSRGKAPMVEQTLFTGLDGKPIPWKLLEGVEMRFIPLLHIKRMYVGGGKASIQMEVLSAIVTSVKARNTTPKQLATIHRLQAARPELQDTVAAQLARLSAERQEALLASQGLSNDAADEEQPNAPTFSSINTGQKPAPSANISGFVGGAPMRHIPDIGGTQSFN